MNTDLIARAAEHLSAALGLLDEAHAPPELGARLQELILRMEAMGLRGDDAQSSSVA